MKYSNNSFLAIRTFLTQFLKSLILMFMWGETMPLIGCTCIKDLWNSITHYYKDLKDLNIRHTMAFIVTHNNLMINIP
jgi:TATA-box binding protein (TBP) (component of TFIID and TFIIIB)